VRKALGWRFSFIGGQERARAVGKWRWSGRSYGRGGEWQLRPLRLRFKGEIIVADNAGGRDLQVGRRRQPWRLGRGGARLVVAAACWTRAAARPSKIRWAEWQGCAVGWWRVLLSKLGRREGVNLEGAIGMRGPAWFWPTGPNSFWAGQGGMG
jgi:hypothetical protein